MGKIMMIERLKRKQLSLNIILLLITSLLQLGMMTAAKADFTNGGFESPYAPTGTVTSDPINGWTSTGFLFNGNATNAPPTSIAGINLGSGGLSGGILDIYDTTNPDFPNDYFLKGATPTPTLTLPGNGPQSASINFRSTHTPFAHAGVFVPNTAGWSAIPKQATSIRQQITVQTSDLDPADGKVHVRFIAAPVLDDAAEVGHQMRELPFFAIQLNNITTGRTVSNPLFFQWNFATQPSVPWKTLTAAGTNLGGRIGYQYTDWQSFDISPGNAFIHVGDTIEFVALASACAPGGHDGHLYLDDIQTKLPSKLWVNVTGPVSTTPGSTVTYTYRYTNNNSVAVNNVTVVANLPQGTPPLQSNGNPGLVTPAQNTTYVSNTNPTTGSCSGAGPVTCNVGTLQPGQTGTFTVKVAIPGTWVTTPDSVTSGPINNGNYPISGDGVAALLGPLVQTSLVAPTAASNLVANTNGMPTTFVPGTPYTGSFTCTNASNLSASSDAPDATCDITNLPPGLAVSQCTISPSGAVWTQPTVIPANQTVTCNVSGTPTTAGAFTAIVSTNASNNSNSTSNIATAPISSPGSSGIPVPATLNGKRILNPAIACCGRPIILHNLPGAGQTTYKVTARTGNVRCAVKRSKSKTFLKVNGSRGSCTVVGTKNGITTLPLTIRTPKPLR